jgi:hypothetical protein
MMIGTVSPALCSRRHTDSPFARQHQVEYEQMRRIALNPRPSWDESQWRSPEALLGRHRQQSRNRTSSSTTRIFGELDLIMRD